MKRNTMIIMVSALLALVLVACDGPAEPAAESDTLGEETSTDVTFMLDWVPNINHTGLYVAQDQGYFEEADLNIEIIEPGEVFAEQAVAGGQADFGISFQEQVTLARAQNETPLVSIAAIIQHNTSGFAARADTGADSPADWEGLTYGSFGSPFEEPTLQSLIVCDGGDFSQLEVVDTGFSDPLALLDTEQIDVAWIFYGVQGVQAEQQDIDLNIVMMNEWFDCIPDYYTPVIIASEDTVQNRPEVASALLEAISRGYQFAIDNPDEAATILLEAVPELDEQFVREGQAWMSPRYAADAPQWGHQELSVWEDYGNWMIEEGIIETFDANAAFTTEFLP